MDYSRHFRKVSAVVSLTILDGTTLNSSGDIHYKTKILIGIRDAITNLTDPNVMSVPTQRIPARFLNGFKRKAEKIDINGIARLGFPERLSEAYWVDSEKVNNRLLNGHRLEIYTVEALLARKLGLAKALEKNKIYFQAWPTVLLSGSILHEKISCKIPGKLVKVQGQDYYLEYIKMLNMNVELFGTEFIPKRTASYSQIRWVNADEFIKMVETKNHKLLLSIFGKQSVGYCVHGLCLISAYVSINRQLFATDM